MNIFKKLFSKKEEQKEKSIVRTQGSILCEYCQNEILQHEPRTKTMGKSFHRRCYKKSKKEAMKKLYG